MSGRLVCVIGLTLVLVSCAGDRPTPYLARAPAQPGPVWTAEDYDYRVVPGDELALRFIVDPDLNAPVVVGPNGRAVFPLISSLAVAGLTVPQLDAILTRRYADVLRNPQVQVQVAAYAASQIYISGEVKTPGVFAIRGQLTVAQAVATAGGLTDTARTGKVVLLRQKPGQARPLVRVIDVSTLYRYGADNDPAPVLPGDVIFVPKSQIREIDLFVDQYINGALPFSRSLDYNIGNVRY